MEWSTDTKNGYNVSEVYMEYGYVFVCTTDKNHAKMAYTLVYRKHKANKMFAGYILSSLCLTLSPFSQVCYAIYGTACFPITDISYDDYDNNLFNLITIIKSKIRISSHFSILNREMMPRAVSHNGMYA